MIKTFKVGGIYKLTRGEDFGVITDNSKSQYYSEEFTSQLIILHPGTILTYIRSVIEIYRDGPYGEPKFFTVPVFYYGNQLIVGYTMTNDFVDAVDEVVDNEQTP